MGNSKRRCSSEDDIIRRKIKKLEEKLNKRAKRRRIIESSDSETETAITDTTAATQSPPTQSRDDQPSHTQAPVVDNVFNVEETAPPDENALQAAHHSVEESVSEKELDPDILELLGDAPKSDVMFGPAVHKDIATRWQAILFKGLPKEAKEKLLKEYVVPSSCDLLTAPELNPETKVALPESLVKRDSSIYLKQKQTGIALSALAISMDRVIRKDTTQNILKPLSDACRILCDSHFGETRTRRNFVLGAVNSSLKDTLLNTNRDKYLFGENVCEKLKSAKVVQRSADELKIPVQKSQFNKNNFVKKNNLNSQHRKTQPKSQTQVPRSGFSQQRPMTRSQARQQQDRPPQRATHSPPRRTTSTRR